MSGGEKSDFGRVGFLIFRSPSWIFSIVVHLSNAIVWAKKKGNTLLRLPFHFIELSEVR